MTFLLQSQVEISPAAIAKIKAEMPTIEEGMVFGLNWIIRSYRKNPGGPISQEKTNFFGWGGFKADEICVEFVWEIGSSRIFVQDGRWQSSDQLKMHVKGGAFILESA